MRLTNRPCITKTANRLGYSVLERSNGVSIEVQKYHSFTIDNSGELSYTRDWQQMQDHVDRFMQGYTIEEQRLIAAEQGYFLTEEQDAETGDIVLSAHAY